MMKITTIKKKSELDKNTINNLMELIPSSIYQKLNSKELIYLLDLLYFQNCKGQAEGQEAIKNSQRYISIEKAKKMQELQGNLEYLENHNKNYKKEQYYKITDSIDILKDNFNIADMMTIWC